MPRLNLKHVRGQFPALGGDAVFLDNAGGSQVAKPVADRIFDFMFTANVQLGASRGTSVAAGKKVAVGRNALATMFNADRPEEVVTGATATQFFDQLARSLLRHWQPNDEDVVTDFDHEANIGPWLRLRQHGIRTRTWELRPGERRPTPESLEPLLGPKTRLVAMTHCSSVFGGINDVRAIAGLVHARGAMLCVDGVAHAPHRAIDAKALDAEVDPSGIGIRFGDFHSRRLVRALDLGDPDGVIRVSAEHCNTLDEMDRLIEQFESLRRRAA